MAKNKSPKTVESFKHDDATRKNIPTAEFQPLFKKEDQSPIRIAYERRNRDLDPQLVWRGKDEQDWSDLVVQAPPLYIQEKVHPKVLIDDLIRQTEKDQTQKQNFQYDLFADFNGIPSGVDKTEFYQHDQNWSNRMILGDSLQVMASLAEREGLRGKVQCIYIDPPYGIRFNSNFQWSTTSRDVKDGKAEHITREPEQVKAFRDTWRDGIHSYLTYLRDRLTVARDLLSESGSIILQIGDENVHLARSLLDEIFRVENRVSLISFQKTSSQTDVNLSSVADYLLWYAKDIQQLTFRRPFQIKDSSFTAGGQYSKLQLVDYKRVPMSKEQRETRAGFPGGSRIYRHDTLTSQSGGEKTSFKVQNNGRVFSSGKGFWKTNKMGMERLAKANRLGHAKNSLSYIRFIDDFPVSPIANLWTDTLTGSFTEDKIYVVQTAQKVIQRCILSSTDPGDLVLDPTCGSGTTAYVAEQWGRRWITIDTSRVALALARARLMGARYPYYLLADSREGQVKEAEITMAVPSIRSVHGNISHGFVYERVPHITLKSIANNTEIDVIWEKWEQSLVQLREELSRVLGKKKPIEEWEIPRELPENWPLASHKLFSEFWKHRIARQKEIDASISAKADFEFLYDKPYEDKKIVRVAGPFTVESLSPHRMLGVDENDELIDPLEQIQTTSNSIASERQTFPQMILENLKTSGVQQAHKEDKMTFISLKPWPGDLIVAEGTYCEGDQESSPEKRAAIFIGPEFGTVTRPDLVAAAREAGDSDFDVLIACAFNYEAHTTDFSKLGRIPVLKARMNADLHMAEDLKNTGKGNLFVIFGEPDIDIIDAENGQISIRVKGIDVFKPQKGTVEKSEPDELACWFIDTDYNEESFFVRHAYFLGANDPYNALKTTLKSEINKEAWESLHSDISRPFDKPTSGRIAVKVINHLGDEVMKVFRV